MSYFYTLSDDIDAIPFLKIYWELIIDIRKNPELSKLDVFLEEFRKRFCSYYSGLIYIDDKNTIKSYLQYPPNDQPYFKHLDNIDEIKKKILDLDSSEDINYYNITKLTTGYNNETVEFLLFKVPQLNIDNHPGKNYYIYLIKSINRLPINFSYLERGFSKFYLDQLSGLIEIWIWKMMYDSNVLYEKYQNELKIILINREMSQNEKDYKTSKLKEKIEESELSKKTIGLLMQDYSVNIEYNQLLDIKKKNMDVISYFIKLEREDIDTIRNNPSKLKELSKTFLNLKDSLQKQLWIKNYQEVN